MGWNMWPEIEDQLKALIDSNLLGENLCLVLIVDLLLQPSATFPQLQNWVPGNMKWDLECSPPAAGFSYFRREVLVVCH